MQYLQKKVRGGVHFLHADEHQSFHKFVLSFLIEGARHVQSTQNRKLLIFLQYLEKKKIFIKCTFCMQINMKASCKLILTFWVCLAKQNFTPVMKYCSAAIAFIFNCDVKHWNILWGSSHVCCYLLFYDNDGHKREID